MDKLNAALVMALAVAPFLVLALRVGLGFWITSTPNGREQGQALADFLEAAEVLVAEVEAARLPGSDKLAAVRSALESELRAKGINGEARRMYEQHIPAIIEMALARVQPKQAS